MEIKKIVFTPLSSSSLAYTAIGWIRFYDVDWNQIDVLGSGVVTDDPETFETDKVLITASNSYHNGDQYNVWNAFRNDRPQTGAFWDRFYWLSSNDNQTLTVEFKTPIDKISKIEFNPRPDSKYSNRGVDEDFEIQVYDSGDKLIKTYTVTPEYKTVNNIQTIETPELTEIKKILFAKPDGSVWRYDNKTNSWIQVKTNKNLLKSEDFQKYGHDLPFNIDKTKLTALDVNPEVLAWSDDSSKTSANMKLDFVSYEKLIVQNNPLSLLDYETINSITVNTKGTGKIRFLFSRDLNNWYKWNGSDWQLIKSWGLDYTSQPDINLVLNEGMSPSTINSLTWTEIQKLYSGSSATPDKIWFAFALQNDTGTDDITLTSLKLNCNPKAFWKDVSKDCEIQQGYQSIIITFNLDWDFKVNYMD